MLNEQKRQLLGPRTVGKFLQQPQERTRARHALRDAGGSEGGYLQVHRSVLQPQAVAFDTRLGVAADVFRLPIERPNHVGASDITYIPMQRGFVYLFAVVGLR